MCQQSAGKRAITRKIGAPLQAEVTLFANGTLYEQLMQMENEFFDLF